MRGIAILLVVLNHTIALGTSYPIQAGITFLLLVLNGISYQGLSF
jgi:multidrug transporter EmrE-like cation transporter